MSKATNRLAQSRHVDFYNKKVIDLINKDPDVSTDTFQLGEVIDVDKSSNRLKVRIPIIDDIFYDDNNDEESGDKDLPWCLPTNSRFIDTPEKGNVVLVGLFNTDNPFLGRIWLSEVDSLSSDNIFKRLSDSEKEKEGWEGAEEAIGVKFDKSPYLRDREGYNSFDGDTNYEIGIRGKDKNRITLEDGKIIIIQNEGDNDETKIDITESVKILASDAIEIKSDKGGQDQEPVFADPLFDFLTDVINYIQQLQTSLSATPGNAGNIPVTTNPSITQLTSKVTNLQTKLQKLKQNGKSDQITIN